MRLCLPAGAIFRHALLPLALARALAGVPAAAAEPGLTAFTLDNGLDVIVIEDHRAPVVTQMLWYRAGSAEDPPGQGGTAHFLEHLMFKATDRLAAGEFSAVVAANGGSGNAFTSIDQTAYFQRIAADRLDLVMGMEADRMANFAPSEESVVAEREVVRRERGERIGGDPGGLLRERLMAALYPDLPDGRPTIGSDAEIAGLTREGEMAFYRAHYAPNAAILVVAGDVRPDAVRAMAERHFGPIPPRPGIAPRRGATEAPRGPARIELRDARVAQPQFTRLYLAPPRRPGEQREAAALVVLADLLGGDRVTSMLNRELVQGDGIALAAGAFYGGTGLDTQTFGFSVVPKPGVGLDQAEAALDAFIARVAAEEPDPAEIARIRGRLRAQEIYGLDDIFGRANRIGEALTSGLTLDDIDAWPAILQQVTPADVQEAARSVLRAEASVTGRAMPPDPGAAAAAARP